MCYSSRYTVHNILRIVGYWKSKDQSKPSMHRDVEQDDVCMTPVLHSTRPLWELATNLRKYLTRYKFADWCFQYRFGWSRIPHCDSDSFATCEYISNSLTFIYFSMALMTIFSFTLYDRWCLTSGDVSFFYNGSWADTLLTIRLPVTSDCWLSF